MMASAQAIQSTYQLNDGIRRSLYISHFLSTWNMRAFEFGAVLFLATIFPGTLLPLSLYALLRALAAIGFSPAIGRYIDRTDRLPTIRLSIVGQRLPVILSCLVFWLLLEYQKLMPNVIIGLCFGLSVLLACMEKLSATMNIIAVERDWVVSIAENDSILQSMNSQMRRIDLFCKLVGPLAIALLDGWSTKVAILATLGVNMLSVSAEYLLIAKVFQKVASLSRSRQGPSECVDGDFEQPPEPRTMGASGLRMLMTAIKLYTSQKAFLPSFSLCCLYLTVLSFAGQMTTYLLANSTPRLTSTTIGFLRTASTVLEISATFIAPQIMNAIGPVRAGMWSLSWQMLCLTPAVAFFFTSTPPISVISIIIGVILSRIGLWVFDLSAQQIIQESVEAQYRGSFSSIEASFQNLFELLTFAMTIVFPRPEQFKYPALVSLVAVYVAALLYAKFVRDQRGHLLHMPLCLKPHRYKRVGLEMELGHGDDATV